MKQDEPIIDGVAWETIVCCKHIKTLDNHYMIYLCTESEAFIKKIIEFSSIYSYKEKADYGSIKYLNEMNDSIDALLRSIIRKTGLNLIVQDFCFEPEIADLFKWISEHNKKDEILKDYW